ncbi:hypothetical protein MX850_06325 [Erysipelothrix sp. Poltava]|nr:hypothetical protein MX850_06325 [Erysipelothrix sp. Poltava]
MTVLTYSISNGIACGFIAYIIVEVSMKRGSKVHPIVYGSALLFILNFVITAMSLIS